MSAPGPGHDDAGHDDAGHDDEGHDDEGHDDDVVELAHRLLDAARAGRTQELAAYVVAGVPVDLTSPSGDTLLMLAAYHGHAETVQALASRGADVDRANDRGQTPLAGAVFKGETDVVRALAAAGADAGLGSPSARQAADFFGRPDLAALLPTAGEPGQGPA